MNYDHIISTLKQWSAEELWLKRRFYNQETSDLAEQLDPQFLEYTLHPEKLTPHKTEDRFFRDTWNTALIKHSRYLSTPLHEHSFFEAIYVLSGHCHQIIGNQHIFLKSGDICLLAPNITHSLEVFDDDSIILNILIRQSTFTDMFLNIIRDNTPISIFFLSSIYATNHTPYLIYHTEKDEIIRNYVLDMYEEFQFKDAFSDRIISNLLSIFLLKILIISKSLDFTGSFAG